MNEYENTRYHINRLKTEALEAKKLLDNITQTCDEIINFTKEYEEKEYGIPYQVGLDIGIMLSEQPIGLMQEQISKTRGLLNPILKSTKGNTL